MQGDKDQYLVGVLRGCLLIVDKGNRDKHHEDHKRDDAHRFLRARPTAGGACHGHTQQHGNHQYQGDQREYAERLEGNIL